MQRKACFVIMFQERCLEATDSADAVLGLLGKYSHYGKLVVKGRQLSAQELTRIRSLAQVYQLELEENARKAAPVAPRRPRLAGFSEPKGI